MKPVRIFALIIALSLLMPLAFGCADKPDLTADATKTSELTSPSGTDSSSLTLYVSPNGDDTADGSIGSPLATLSGAAAAASKATAPHVEIVMAEGTYHLSSALVLPTELTNGRTVRIIGDGDVLISGMTELSPSDFYIPNDEVSARFKDDAREHIVAIDLSKYGVDVSAFAALEPENRVPYMNGKQLTLARYPDATEKYMKIRSVKSDDWQDWKTCTFGLSKTVSNELATWASMDGVRIFGYPKCHWAPVYTAVDSFDADAMTVTADLEEAAGAQKGNELCFINAPEALTQPSEYYWSDDGILYIYKTDDFDSSVISVPTISDMMIDFTGLNGITFENLSFTGTFGSSANLALKATFSSSDNIVGAALYSDSSNDVTVKNCEIYGTVSGICVSGSNILIENNVLHNIRSCAIAINGGDRATLTSSGNVITNNLIHDWSENGLTYQPAVSVFGVGNLVSHNEIYSSNHLAIGIKGNNNTVEYNDIHDVLTYTSDAGAIYLGRSLTNVGNVIRYNWLHSLNTTNIANDLVGIYFDDCQAGCTAYGNIVGDVYGSSFLIGGGPSNNIFGNIMYGATYRNILYDARGYKGYFDGGWFSHIIDFTKDAFSDADYYDSDEWHRAYPWLYAKTITDEPDPNDPTWLGAPGEAVVKDNLYLIKEGSDESTEYEKDLAKGKALKCVIDDAVRLLSDEVEDVNFLITENITYSLDTIAALDLPDYIDIDFDEIGRK